MRRLLFAALLLCAPAAAARADSFSDVMSWTMCTTGTRSACAKIEISTTPFFCLGAICGATGAHLDEGPGTQVTLKLRNLQGSDLRDNVFASRFGAWEFRWASNIEHGTITAGNTPSFFDGPVGTATGAYLNQFIGGCGPLPGSCRMFLGNADGDRGLYGCETAAFFDNPFDRISGVQTCDPKGFTGSVAFVSKFTGEFHASDLTSMAVDGTYFDESNDPFDRLNLHCDTAKGTCAFAEINGVVVTPEPFTLGLMALGLLTICGMALRRKPA